MGLVGADVYVFLSRSIPLFTVVMKGLFLRKEKCVMKIEKDDLCTFIDYMRSIVCDDICIYEIVEMNQLMAQYCSDNNINPYGYVDLGLYVLKLYPRHVFDDLFELYYGNDDGCFVDDNGNVIK